MRRLGRDSFSSVDILINARRSTAHVVERRNKSWLAVVSFSLLRDCPHIFAVLLIASWNNRDNRVGFSLIVRCSNLIGMGERERVMNYGYAAWKLNCKCHRAYSFDEKITYGRGIALWLVYAVWQSSVIIYEWIIVILIITKSFFVAR